MCAEGIDMRWHICIRSTPYMIDYYSWRKGVAGNNAKTMLSSMQSVVYYILVPKSMQHSIILFHVCKLCAPMVLTTEGRFQISSNTTPVRTRC